MRSLKNVPIIAASLACVHCFQHSYTQLSISDSQTSDSMQASAGARTTGVITSGGPSQTGSASEGTALSVTADGGTSMQTTETVEITTGLTTQDTSASGNSTPDTDTDATSAGTTTGEEAECLWLDGKCHDWNEVRLVFVTNERYNGAKIKNADALCVKAAKNLHGAEEYKAWATVNETPPVNRFVHKTFTGPYVKLNPEYSPELNNDEVIPVAMGWNGLTTQDLIAAIDVTETGQTATGSAWTRAKSNGTFDPDMPSCKQWSSDNNDDVHGKCEPSADDYGTIGAIGEKSPLWSYASGYECDEGPGCCHGIKSFKSGVRECDEEHHLYCFQDRKVN